MLGLHGLITHLWLFTMRMGSILVNPQKENIISFSKYSQVLIIYKIKNFLFRRFWKKSILRIFKTRYSCILYRIIFNLIRAPLLIKLILKICKGRDSSKGKISMSLVGIKGCHSTSRKRVKQKSCSIIGRFKLEEMMKMIDQQLHAPTDFRQLLRV